MPADILDLTGKPDGYYDNMRDDMLKYMPKVLKTTLEFGCGTGRFSALLKKEFGAETWAVEIDEQSAKTASGKLDNVINSDAHKAIDKLPDSYFDCIIFFDILEHLIDPYSLLVSIKKKLTENGIIVASIPNIRYYRALVDYVIRGNWTYKEQGILDSTHLRFFTRKSLLKMFDNLKFKIHTLEGIHPTRSRNFRIINFFLCNALEDMRYLHYVAVISPQ